MSINNMYFFQSKFVSLVVTHLDLNPPEFPPTDYTFSEAEVGIR